MLRLQQRLPVPGSVLIGWEHVWTELCALQVEDLGEVCEEQSDAVYEADAHALLRG